VYLLALMKVDGTPRVSLQTRVEEPRRILESRPLGEGHLHDTFVSLARADQTVVRPHRNSSPLPLLDDFRIGLLDQATEPAQHLAPPVAQLLDSCIDELGGRPAWLRIGLFHIRFSVWVPRLGDSTPNCLAYAEFRRGQSNFIASPPTIRPRGSPARSPSSTSKQMCQPAAPIEM